MICSQGGKDPKRLDVVLCVGSDELKQELNIFGGAVRVNQNLDIRAGDCLSFELDNLRSLHILVAYGEVRKDEVGTSVAVLTRRALNQLIFDSEAQEEYVLAGPRISGQEIEDLWKTVEKVFGDAGVSFYIVDEVARLRSESIPPVLSLQKHCSHEVSRCFGRASM